MDLRTSADETADGLFEVVFEQWTRNNAHRCAKTMVTDHPLNHLRLIYLKGMMWNCCYTGIQD